MEWIDTHFHGGEYLPDYRVYAAEAEQENVHTFVLCASGADETADVLKAAEAHPGIRIALGIHPHNAGSDEGFIAELKNYPGHPRLVAVGEIGLDYYYDLSDREKQREVFEKQLSFALEHELPAIIHCRDKDQVYGAYDDAYEQLSSFAGKGGRFVLHCYAGTIAYAEKFAALGGYFGVGGMLTFGKADNIREVVSVLPLDRIFLETDAPYLAPKPYRGKPNHSKYIPIIGAKLAELRSISLEECAAFTTANARRFFSIKGESDHV
ncbi:MAG: TatD family hydrolase [Lentisphaeria bacterium]|nr:TatD family hydrolase [Lentisphaeria bacterium]